MSEEKKSDNSGDSKLIEDDYKPGKKDYGYKPLKKGYQPSEGNLNPSNPPQGGSGVSSSSSEEDTHTDKKD